MQAAPSASIATEPRDDRHDQESRIPDDRQDPEFKIDPSHDLESETPDEPRGVNRGVNRDYA